MRRQRSLTVAVGMVLLVAVPLMAKQNTASSGNSDSSLGDIARKVRPKDAKVTIKRVYTDDDVAHGAGQPTIPNPSGTPEDYRKQTETYLEATEAYLATLEDKTPRELGEIVAKDIQFPGRDRWEAKLATSRNTLVSTTKAAVYTVRRSESLLEDRDVNKAREAQTVVHDQMIHIQLARQDFEHVLSEGATLAGEWESKSR